MEDGSRSLHATGTPPVPPIDTMLWPVFVIYGTTTFHFTAAIYLPSGVCAQGLQRLEWLPPLPETILWNEMDFQFLIAACLFIPQGNLAVHPIAGAV